MASLRPSAPSLSADQSRPSLELKTWLTQDLKVKGAPSGSRPPEPVDSRPPAPGSAALPGDAPVNEQSAFGRWLMNDVRPRPSVAPDSIAPPRDVEPSGSVAPDSPAPAPEPRRAGGVAPDSLAPAPAPDSPAPAPEPRRAGGVAPDSLAPQLVSLPDEGAPKSTQTALDDDDFSVLPGRRKRQAPLARPSLVALCLLLFGAGFFVMRSTVPAADSEEAPADAAAVRTTGALPPPPPEQAPLEAEPSPEEDEETAAGQPVGAPRPASAEGEKQLEPADPLDPVDPLWRLSKARFPDLPLPTLSRLARDELEQARQRDAAARDAKKKRP